MAHVLVLGAGGNIGSHLIPHLGRMDGVDRITLIDRDRYESRNLRTQNIEPRDVGKPKVVVQARQLHGINPALIVSALHCAIEDLPLGALRADVMLACLDSRRARLIVNQSAWRLGVPWIDAGVDGDGLLVRVQAFAPSIEAPCIECAWTPDDYAAVEQSYPCHADAPAAPSNAPSSLGALAAAIQAIECEKLLAGRTAELLSGRDVLIDARHHKQFVTSFRRNTGCRMPDHAGWRIDPIDGTPAQVTLGDVWALGSVLRGSEDRLCLSVAGHRLVLALTCAHCGGRHQVFRLERALRHKAPSCPRCHQRMQITGFDEHDAVSISAMPENAHDWPLSFIGLRAGDVVSLATPAVTAHYQIGGPR